MPYEMEFTIRVTAQDEQEAMKLQEAVYSGYAAEIMRIGVLYGQIPVGGAVSPGTAPYIDQSRQEAKAREAQVQVQRVESRKVSVASSTSGEKVEQRRPTGLAGRRRLGRS